MNNISLLKLGGVGALLVFLCSGLFALLVLFAPQTALEPGEVPWSYVLGYYALALVGVFGLAVVPPVSRRVAAQSEGWMRWTSTLALVGFAVLGVTHFWAAEYETTLFLEYDGPLGGEIGGGLLVGFQGVDWTVAREELLFRIPQGWFEVAGIGLWVFSVSWLARGAGLLPKGLVRLGLLGGGFSLLVPLGASAQVWLLHFLGTAVGLVLTPWWFCWIGVLLLREESRQRKPEPSERLAEAGPTPEERGAPPPSRWQDRVQRPPGRTGREPERTADRRTQP